MSEMSGSSDFLDETLGSHGRGEVRVEDLDGDVSLMFQVVRQVHRRHTADTDLPVETVSRR